MPPRDDTLTARSRKTNAAPGRYTHGKESGETKGKIPHVREASIRSRSAQPSNNASAVKATPAAFKNGSCPDTTMRTSCGAGGSEHRVRCAVYSREAVCGSIHKIESIHRRVCQAIPTGQSSSSPKTSALFSITLKHQTHPFYCISPEIQHGSVVGGFFTNPSEKEC